MEKAVARNGKKTVRKITKKGGRRPPGGGSAKSPVNTAVRRSAATRSDGQGNRPLAHIYRGKPANLARLARALRRGELVAVPTETVYGLAANALDARACRQIFQAKGRPASDPLIVHLLHPGDLTQVAVPNDAALRLARKFWPGPLTLVLPKRAIVPDVVSAGRPSVAVRVPSHPLFRLLLEASGLPLAAPSANAFGYVSPTTAAHVQAGLGHRIAHILDGGASAIGLESTIVDLRDPKKPRLLRPGAITRRELERALGRRVPLANATRHPTRGAQLAPGLLQRHYSPRTPVELHARIDPSQVAKLDPHGREAWLFLARPKPLKAAANLHWLDPHGDLRGAARRLFGQLRALDAGGWKKIHVELAPGSGLADAINDRLRRAAAR
jgi:L-threonylcarbamoyladenylate synthase